MKRILLFISSLVACVALYSQASKLPNTLLWRISGNNLTKPSYLYGTMHLTDKRVFLLGDSLYKAIEQTEGFAAELDMNSLGMQMINYIIADKEARAAKEAVKIKDVVSQAIWERYKDQLQKKFYKPADKITVDDLEELGSSLETDLFKKGEMPTFLDAYLFGLARKQGKWVGGVEEFNDQIEHLTADDIEDKIHTALFDDKYYRSGMEEMIRIYTAQMLDSLDALMYREENGRKDYIMIKRNLKMAKMMDSLSFVRSTFFAVGAAHLPGDSGVIALLQRKGFTLTPVISSKKISADKYVVKAKEIPWLPVNIKDSVYGLQMPGVAGNFEMLESIGVDMKMFFDISFMKVYMTFGVELSADRKKLGADSLYNSMRSRFFDKSKDVKEKLITVNGIEGRELSGSNDDGEMKIQVFLPRMEEIVLNAVFSLSKKSLNDDETNKFFRSFTYNGLNKTSIETEKTWSILSYPDQLFSIEWPSKPKETKDVNSQQDKITYTYQTMDVKNQAFYGMSVTSVKEGMYRPGFDTTYFILIKETLKLRLEDSKVLDSSFISFSNYPGYKIRIIGKTQGESFETKVLMVARGSRVYYLYAVYSPIEENRSVADRYFGSFKILPAAAAEWRTIISPDTSFSVASNVPLKKIKPDEEGFHPDAERFILYDPVISSTTFIDKTILPEWLWYSSDTAFLRQRAHQYKRYADSIVDYNVTTKGSQRIADFMLMTKGTGIIKRVKLVLNGNELFELYGYYDPMDLKESYGKIFDQFIAKKVSAQTDRSGSKINELAEILQHADVENIRQVSWWWNSLKFSASDLPALQKMLLKIYPDFDSISRSGINRTLFYQVEELDSLHTTVDYIKENYNSIAKEDEHLLGFVIHYLAGVKTTESYSVLKNILVDYPLKTNSSIYPLINLFDSLKLTATLFPEILKYADSEMMGPYIQGLTITLLDSGMISKKMIIENGKRFINYAKKKLDKDKESVEQYAYDYYDCIKILGIINSPESNALLARFAKFDNRGIRFKTLVAQMSNNQPVDSRTLYTMATTDEYRYDLYIEMKKWAS
jgi:uncharacterized protein YbaP (TraB family)